LKLGLTKAGNNFVPEDAARIDLLLLI